MTIIEELAKWKCVHILVCTKNNTETRKQKIYVATVNFKGIKILNLYYLSLVHAPEKTTISLPNGT